MFKLTNSFCRYLKLTNVSIPISRIHASKFTEFPYANYLNSVRNHVVNSSIGNFYNNHQIRLHTNGRKQYRPKKSKNCNEPKPTKQMSDSFNPTYNHVSYGGQFEVSSTNDSSGSQKRKTSPSSPGSLSSSSESTTSASKKRPQAIPADFRVWEQVLQRNDTSENSNSFKFKILSYNVLAQYLLECHPYLYTECTPYNLTWNVRAARLFDEIVMLSPDIICLQEVQVSHLQSFYSKFEHIGYFGVFKQKTGSRQDGCAIYFKQSLFDLRDHITVEYYQPELPILNRDNIGVMVKLMPKNYRGPPIVIATTHLLYNPKRTDVRLAQLQVLLAEIDRFAYHSNGRESGHLPIILTGDFNSTPDSAVIKLLDRGQVRASSFRDTSDWSKIGVTDNCQHLSVYLNRQKGLETDFCMTKIYNSDYRELPPENSATTNVQSDHCELFNSHVVSYSLNLASTYSKYKQDGCREATTFQDFWVTVDYIYFSYCSNLRLLERLRLPTTGECDVLGRLPNDAYGSDHLVLAAVFELHSSKSSL